VTSRRSPCEAHEPRRQSSWCVHTDKNGYSDNCRWVECRSIHARSRSLSQTDTVGQSCRNLRSGISTRGRGDPRLSSSVSSKLLHHQRSTCQAQPRFGGVPSASLRLVNRSCCSRSWLCCRRGVLLVLVLVFFRVPASHSVLKKFRLVFAMK